ncbi:MAG: hypothetical protein AB2A00_10805 [Myxococcota bacterium]
MTQPDRGATVPAMATKRTRNAAVFPAEAFKLFRDMRDSMKKMEAGQEQLRKEVHGPRKDLVGLFDRTDRPHREVRAEIRRDKILRDNPA